MDYETVLGLRKEHTFDEVRQYIQADPTIIKFPKRDALFFSQSHIYGQIEASMKSYEAGVKDQANYRESDEQKPYVPPRPKPPKFPRDTQGDTQGDPDVSMGAGTDDYTDQITGGNPPAPPAPPAGLVQQLLDSLRREYSLPPLPLYPLCPL
jgi:hypothetical protein